MSGAPPRNAMVVARYVEGVPLTVIATAFGITKQRVSQIIARANQLDGVSIPLRRVRSVA